MDTQETYSQLLQAGLSARSVEQCHAVLHRALQHAVRWGLVGRNAADAVSPPRPGRRELRTRNESEVQRLFAATVDHRLHALWVLVVTTGLRLGEALGLRWEDLDLESGRLVVRRALQRQRGAGLVFTEPKTERSRRTVHLAPGTLLALADNRRRQLEERLGPGRSGKPRTSYSATRPAVRWRLLT